MLSDSITEAAWQIIPVDDSSWKEGMPVHVAKYLDEVVRVVVSS